MILEARQALAAGTYTYQVQIASSAVGNTAKINASSTEFAFLQAVQV